MSGTVLVVEDDPSVRDVLHLTLDSEGYAVVPVEDGLEALERLEQGLPDVILLDLMLPRLDGDSFLAELERRGLWPGIPVIVLSAAVGSDRWASRVRADGYVAKPFDIAALLEEVRRVASGGALVAAG